MAFRFGSPGASAFNNPSSALTHGEAQAGQELEEIQTESLGFQSLAGEAKVRLLPSPWPTEALPPPTSSLLSLASQKGLLAAGGPDSVIVASTEAVRKAFTANETVEGNVHAFTPQLTLKLGMRISQVSFSADESLLVLSAENGGGLAVYEVKNLMQGMTESAAEISTNGSLRSLSPNPTPEKAEFFAAVTVEGKLLMANLATQQIMSGPQGMVMKDGVSCISWSPRGKQLVAGLGDGTCCQLTPDGTPKAEIPLPPNIEGDQHVSALCWLETDLFLLAHTVTTKDEGMIPGTTFNIVTRQSQPQTLYTFQKLPDPSPPFGMNRSPPYQFMQRLRNFPPDLSDLIVVASTASADVGLVTRSQTALTGEFDIEKITKVFTTTTMANDTRRAQLPMAEDLSDTSPIGMALDLSATEKVARPLPNEEMDESPGPIPALMLLNNDGLLTSWWIVYAESIRQGTTYPGLTVAAGLQPQPQAANSIPPAPATTIQNTPSPFASGSFTSPSSQMSAFSATPKPAFGSTGLSSAFGAPSTLGSKPSLWGSGTSTGGVSQGTGATFGQPTFGSSTQLGMSSGGAAFGMPGGIGSRPSPWSAPSSGSQMVGSSFGQTARLGTNLSSTFGSGASSTASNAEPTGGFASFAKAPGFAAAAAQTGGFSSFAQTKPGAATDSGMDTDSAFGGISKDTEIGSRSFASSQFTLGSTFKGDGTSVTDAPRPVPSNNKSLFGIDFSSSLGDVQRQPPAPETKEADMDEESNASEQEAMSEASGNEHESATPVSKPKTSLFGFQQTAPPVAGGLFGTQAQSKTTPALVQSSTPASFPPTQPPPASTTPEDTPKKPEDTARLSISTSTLPIKTEPQEDSPFGMKNGLPDGPLPPNARSKDSYSPGETSQSSTESKPVANDAPLPPDFVPSNTESRPPKPGPEEWTALPDVDDSALDDEGSGVDVAQEISPATDPTRTPKITPGSSFGVPLDRSPEGVFSSKSQSKAFSKAKPLFGEVNKQSPFFFPPPSATQESPRSPSPVRSQPTLENLRPDTARSLSAPYTSNNSKVFPSRRTETKPTASLATTHNLAEDSTKREQERLAKQRAQQMYEQEQNLDDKQDDDIRLLLESEVEPTTVLEDFVAHEDYNQDVDKPGISGQIEKVYRDINSMVDTIGLNARNMEAFARGHEELVKAKGRTQDDLEQSGWCLGEIGELMDLEDRIADQVDGSRIPDVGAKLADLRDLRQDLKKLKARQHDVLEVLRASSDQDQIEAARCAPLPADQASKQKELRDAFKGIQELTGEAERKVFELRTALAASQQSSGGNDRFTKKPTVEAVVKTIMKMTSMIEQRGGEIDILEAQMRKLRVPMMATTLNGSREASPFVTASLRLEQEDTLSKSMGGLRLSQSRNGTPSKRSSVISSEAVSRYRTKMQQRKEMNAIVKQVLKSGKPIVRSLD
ncbi:MAG: hypothetical protein Q9222_004937 [Ikaeria aurantiellina]